MSVVQEIWSDFWQILLLLAKTAWDNACKYIDLNLRYNKLREAGKKS